MNRVTSVAQSGAQCIGRVVHLAAPSAELDPSVAQALEQCAARGTPVHYVKKVRWAAMHHR